MVKYKLIKEKRASRKIWHNYYMQIWYKYHSCFFGSLIFNGKKIKAFNLFLKVKQKIKIMENSDPYFVFLVALMKVTPNVIMFPLRLGGSSQGVPIPISEEKRIAFGVKWILKLLKDRKVRLSTDTIADLLVTSIYNKSMSIDKKLNLYAMSIKNRHLLRFLKVSK